MLAPSPCPLFAIFACTPTPNDPHLSTHTSTPCSETPSIHPTNPCIHPHPYCAPTHTLLCSIPFASLPPQTPPQPSASTSPTPQPAVLFCLADSLARRLANPHVPLRRSTLTLLLLSSSPPPILSQVRFRRPLHPGLGSIPDVADVSVIAHGQPGRQRRQHVRGACVPTAPPRAALRALPSMVGKRRASLSHVPIVGLLCGCNVPGAGRIHMMCGRAGSTRHGT